uniref:Isopenicillin N synthase-like Fe(2+) 2OG dioxygenase domain-containing protein n=2 Tax=Heterosigma akashiwo TaxID=2829 RepID=A0A7S4DAX6_HETAK
MNTQEVQVQASSPLQIEVPRMKLNELRHLSIVNNNQQKNQSKFANLIQRHGFVVLTDIGIVENNYNALIAEFQNFIENNDRQEKEKLKGPVYFNERGVPMWATGYERMPMREAVRARAAAPHAQPWPASAGGLREAWEKTTKNLMQIADRCLLLTLGAEQALTYKEVEEDDNFSVCYALHYPNDESYPDEFAVTEHIDPSLFVIEPCSNVDGLEVLDQATDTWISVEDLCAPGRELVVFTGKALGAATGGRVPGTRHRVRRSRGAVPRCCFIYEQKYAHYYPPPLD